MSDDTEAGAARDATEAVEPPTEVALDGGGEISPPLYAWGQEQDEEPSKARARAIVAVTALSALALAIAAVTGVVVLLSPAPHPLTAIRTSPVEAPPPKLLPITATPAPGSPPAGSHDDQFLAALVNHGASTNSSHVDLNNAHAVCDELGRGVSRPDMTDQVREAGSPNGAGAAVFVALSIDYYCPQYRQPWEAPVAN
jgi:hypothetical protein